MHLITLSILFFLTAILYAAVGFGGGSTYTALLALSDMDYRLIPPISLMCNIIVVTGGALHAWRARILNLKATLPFVILSVPCAFIGGLLPLSEKLFIGLLAAALFLSGLRLLFLKNNIRSPIPPSKTRLWQSIGVGAVLGFISGLVGIGGGIFLAPILYLMRWESPRRIAAICTFFILMNSLAGISGQLLKLQSLHLTQTYIQYWPLAVAVLIGGNIGSFFGLNKFRADHIRLLTALLVLFVALRLTLKYFSL